MGGIENILGLNTTAGTDDLNKALAALQGVGVPTTQQLSLPELQKYVSAGVLTPQQYQAISANPQAYQDAVQQNLDTSGTTAQKSALQQLGGVAQTGSTPIMAAQLANIRAGQNQNDQATRAANLQNAQQRGVAGGGLEFLNNMVGEQNSATNANLAGVNAGANNASLALNAIGQQGQLGGQLQGQSNQMATNAAQAAQQVAQYNSGLQSAANQYNTQNANSAQAANLANAQGISNQNTGNANARTQYNAMVPQTQFSDQMQKAQGVAGAYGNKANLAQNQAAGQNQFTGSLLGTGAQLGAAYMTGGASAAAPSLVGKQPSSGGGDPSQYDYMNSQPLAHGGEVCMEDGGPVPGEPNVPGDSTQNDTVDAKLSPHEIVLPNSVTQAPNAPAQAANFVQQTQMGQPPQGTANSFADILAKLEENGLELRLTASGPQKMAFGGETNPQHETMSAMQNNPSAGFDKGGVVAPQKKDSDYGTLVGLREALRRAAGQSAPAPVHTSTGTAKGYDQGGDVQPNQAPSIGDMTQSLNQTPPTDPSLYQGVSSNDRATLAQQLNQQQHSPSMLAAEGVGGIGDAITSAFGKSPTSSMKNIQDRAQANKVDQLGAMDTQRAQKLQDLQGNQEAQLADSNSQMSKAMRDTFKAAGIPVPDGMPGSIMMKIAPDIGNLALKQATLGIQNTVAEGNLANQQAERAQAKTAQQNTEVKQKADIANAQAERGQKQQELNKAADTEASKHWLAHPGLASEARARLSQGAGAPPASPLQPQDQQAIQWAQSNPNDPRSAQILKLHGIQ
jgi:hypothetical protein